MVNFQKKSDKANLLVVVDYNRKDFLNLLQCCRQDFNLYFIEYASNKEIKNHHYNDYGQVLFWKDFKHAFDLLEKVKPTKVIFYFIESYYHVVLNLACKAASIPTYHLDHGVRDLNVNVRLEHFFKIRKRPSQLHLNWRRLNQLKHRIETRVFLERTIKKLPTTYAQYAEQFIRTRKNNSYLDTYKELNSPLRLTDAYISYSSKTFETHKAVDSLPNTIPNYLIGIPNFDHLASTTETTTTNKALLFIDQGYVDEGLLGWNLKDYQAFIYNFSTICTNYGYKIYAKLHPRQTNKSAKFWLHNSNIQIIDDKELAVYLPLLRLVIGYYSTYLLPLMALPFTTVVTLENHPIGRIDVSKSFVEAGVAHPIYDLEELYSILPNIESLHQKQLPNKAKFTEEWMYKFDGKAGDRLRDILLSDDL